MEDTQKKTCELAEHVREMEDCVENNSMKINDKREEHNSSGELEESELSALDFVTCEINEMASNNSSKNVKTSNKTTKVRNICDADIIPSDEENSTEEVITGDIMENQNYLKFKDNKKCKEKLNFKNDGDLPKIVSVGKYLEDYVYCEECSFHTVTQLEMDHHILVHKSPSNVFCCEICDFTCTKVSHLKLHKLSHADGNNLKCKSCDFSCTDVKEMSSHAASHATNVLRCTLCSYVTNTTVALNKHVSRHFTSDKRYTCEICLFKYKTATTLRNHMKLHTKNDVEHPCKVCSKVFNNWFDLKDHSYTHVKGRGKTISSTSSQENSQSSESFTVSENQENCEVVMENEDIMIEESCVKIEINIDEEEDQRDSDDSSHSEKESKHNILNIRNRDIEVEVPLYTEDLDYKESCIGLLQSNEEKLQHTERVENKESKYVIDTQTPLNNQVIEDKEKVNMKKPEVVTKGIPATNEENELDNDLSDKIIREDLILKIKQECDTQLGSDGFYTCDICTYSTVNCEEWEKHEQTHEKFKLTCSLCPYTSDGKPAMSKHQKMHMIKHTCNVCDFTSIDEFKMNEHKQSHAGIKPFVCEECNISCANIEEWNKHFSTHTDKVNYSCELCTFASFSFDTLLQHNATHTIENPFVCEECGYKCAQKTMLKIHKFRFHQKNFKCEKCDFTCKESKELRKHADTHNPTKVKKFVCDKCDASFTTFQSLKEHTLKHLGLRPYVCDKCPYSSNRLNTLKRHKMAHYNFRPYKCSHCEYSSKRIYTLQRHMKRHTGEKPYDCDECGYKCSLLHELNRHKFKHTGERPYACHICGFACVKSNDLKKHVITHERQKVYTCTQCDFTCREAGNMKTHKLEHPQEKVNFKCEYCPSQFASLKVLRRHKVKFHQGQEIDVIYEENEEESTSECDELSYEELKRKREPELCNRSKIFKRDSTKSAETLDVTFDKDYQIPKGSIKECKGIKKNKKRIKQIKSNELSKNLKAQSIETQLLGKKIPTMVEPSLHVQLKKIDNKSVRSEQKPKLNKISNIHDSERNDGSVVETKIVNPVTNDKKKPNENTKQLLSHLRSLGMEIINKVETKEKSTNLNEKQMKTKQSTTILESEAEKSSETDTSSDEESDTYEFVRYVKSIDSKSTPVNSNSLSSTKTDLKFGKTQTDNFSLDDEEALAILNHPISDETAPKALPTKSVNKQCVDSSPGRCTPQITRVMCNQNGDSKASAKNKKKQASKNVTSGVLVPYVDMDENLVNDIQPVKNTGAFD